MKRINLLVISCLLFQLSGLAQQKRALVVAISEYPKHSGWNKIHANNDLTILLPILEQEGFQERTTTVLANSQATKKNIVKALHDLEKSCQKGDLVFIHFSCHGQQMEDDNGDETDGLDESLVSYDAQIYFKEGEYEGENHLRDDELEVLLFSIRKKIKDNGCLIVSLDACHSQSGSRGMSDEEIVRGTPVIFSKSDFSGINKTDYKDIPLAQWSGLAPIAVISACKSYQQNHEYKAENNLFYGSLTYSICNTDNSQERFSASHKWLENVEYKMKKIAMKQTPVIETTIPK